MRKRIKRNKTKSYLKRYFTKHRAVAWGGTADVPELMLRFVAEAQLRAHTLSSANLLLIQLACRRAEAREPFPLKGTGEKPLPGRQKEKGKKKRSAGKAVGSSLWQRGPRAGFSHQNTGLHEDTGSL